MWLILLKPKFECFHYNIHIIKLLYLVDLASTAPRVRKTLHSKILHVYFNFKFLLSPKLNKMMITIFRNYILNPTSEMYRILSCVYDTQTIIRLSLPAQAPIVEWVGRVFKPLLLPSSKNHLQILCFSLFRRILTFTCTPSFINHVETD